MRTTIQKANRGPTKMRLKIGDFRFQQTAPLNAPSVTAARPRAPARPRQTLLGLSCGCKPLARAETEGTRADCARIVASFPARSASAAAYAARRGVTLGASLQLYRNQEHRKRTLEHAGGPKWRRRSAASGTLPTLTSSWRAAPCSAARFFCRSHVLSHGLSIET